MVSKGRHYRAVERQKQNEQFEEDYPVALDFPALGVIMLGSMLIGLLLGMLFSCRK